METTQSFRLVGGTDVEEIPCCHVNGQTIVYWDEIERVFPGVKNIKNGNVSVILLRDSNENRIEPYRIKHHPNIVLDVVLFTSDGNGPGTNNRNIGHTIASSEDSTIESLQISQILAGTSSSHLTLPSTSALQLQSPSSLKTGSKARLSFNQVMQLAQNTFVGSEVEQQMVSSLPSNLQAQLRDSANTHDAIVQAVKDGLVVLPNEQLVACLQSLNTKMVENNALASRIMELVSENNRLATENNGLTACVIKLQEELGAKQDEMKGLQMQALDRLALIQNSVQALLTQTYELHEYPIPRLFIVLPKDSSSWDPLDIFANKFRLYFLCECGEHTKSTNSKIPHYIHVAKHEGYDITRPNEFFQQYGSYVLTILRMLKLGITVAGVAVPAVSQLVRVDTMDRFAESLKELTKTIEPGLNQAISYIEKVSEDEGEANQGLEGQMTNNEALEGADLRQLESFLKKKDSDRVLGDLYRTVTTEGHVKWVCIDHFRENYHEKAAKAFRDTVEVLYGSFDENIGRVEVYLYSRVQAEQFYLALEKAKSVYELEVTFDNDWDTTQSDFKRLRDALAKSNVGVLDLDLIPYGSLTPYRLRGGYLSMYSIYRHIRSLEYTDGPTSDILNRNQRYDPIFDIMRHPSIQSVSIRNTPLNFVKRSSLQSRNDDFSNLRYLRIDLKYFGDDIPGIKSLVAKAPNLLSLTFYNAGGQFLRIYNAIAKYQTYPVFFQDQPLRILPPMNGSSQSTTDFKNMAELLKVLGGRLEVVGLDPKCEVLRLDRYGLSESEVSGFVKTIENGSRLKGLRLGRWRCLSEQCIKDFASVVARSELRRLDIRLGEKCVHILESIQWEHLRGLIIQMAEEDRDTTRVMRALIDGAKKLTGRVRLEEFALAIQGHYDVRSLSVPEYGLLAAFLSSTSLKELQLGVSMTLEETLSLLRLVDLSRMQELCLHAQGFDLEVDSLLDCLQHATELRYIGLKLARITDEQKERMKARGVQLSTDW
ncbi:hypothetical protein BGX34_011308 [Mortierella sp. NVP85]|nr:hypothetical protein BGX34_011308 [Mortierella sp. NVP85]